MRLKSFVLVFLAFTFAGLLNFSIAETSWLAEENVRAAKYPFVWEMTGVYTLLLLVPLLVLVATRYPVRRGKVASRLLLHAAVFVFYAVSHTLLTPSKKCARTSTATTSSWSRAARRCGYREGIRSGCWGRGRSDQR